MPIPFNIEAKRDDPQRLIKLNGVPSIFYETAEEFNIIVNVIAHLLGKESALYKGEYDYLEEIEAEHPLPEPGSYAHLRVVDGDDIYCSWDNTDKKWFKNGLVKDNQPGIISVAENIRDVLEATGTKYYGTKDGVAGVWDFPALSGGEEPVETLNGFKIYTFQNGYQGGLTYKPFSDFSFEGTRYTVNSSFVLDTAAIPVGQKQQAAIVLNSNGTVTLVYGPADVNPPDPDIDPLTQHIAAQILLSSGAAAPDGVSLQKIYTENAGIAGEEWSTSIIRGGSRWNFASNEAVDGAYCIKGSQLLADDMIEFTPEAAIPIGSFTELTLKIKNLVDVGLPAGTSGGFRFFLRGNIVDDKGRLQPSSVILPSFETVGYEVTNTADWQFLSFKIPAVNLIEITAINFIFDHGDLTVVPTILLDEIKYNDGSAPSGENFATVGFVNRVIQELRSYADETFADKRLSNVAGDLDEGEQTAIKEKLGITEGSEFNIEGGHSSSIYTVSQKLDGGNSI